MSKSFLCDWWMEDRSKCPKLGTEERADRWGAPLHYCKRHAAMADDNLTRDEQPLGRRFVVK